MPWHLISQTSPPTLDAETNYSIHSGPRYSFWFPDFPAAYVWLVTTSGSFHRWSRRYNDGICKSAAPEMVRLTVGDLRTLGVCV